jgi:hypothetical protein
MCCPFTASNIVIPINNWSTCTSTCISKVNLAMTEVSTPSRVTARGWDDDLKGHGKMRYTSVPDPAEWLKGGCFNLSLVVRVCPSCLIDTGTVSQNDRKKHSRFRDHSEHHRRARWYTATRAARGLASDHPDYCIGSRPTTHASGYWNQKVY